MAAPVTTDQLITLIEKSNLIPPDRLDEVVKKYRASGGSEDVQEMMGQLVKTGILTHFQSQQLIQGKWRGFSIGKYKVLERLGSGGMGSVYLCEHLSMHSKVAIKVLPTAKNNDPAALGRFYREARAAGALAHPNLVKAHDIDQDGELHFLVMDFVEGVNLQQLVHRNGKGLSALRSCHYISQAASGLFHAHKEGLVHRDIKPANILLDRFGVIKILDLGLARFFEDNQDLLTLKYDDNNVLGTADYVSPEQAINSHGADTRTDIYSLGATFYFLLASHPPFPKGKISQKLLYAQHKEPTPIQQIRPDVPGRLAVVLSKMMAKDRKNRYQSMEEVVDALAPFVTEPIPAPTEEEIPQMSLAARMAGPVSSATGHSIPAPRSSRSDPMTPTLMQQGPSSNSPAPTWGGRTTTPQIPSVAPPTATSEIPPPLSPAQGEVTVPSHQVPTIQPQSPPPSPSKRKVRAIALILTLIVGGVGGLMLHRYFGASKAVSQDTPPSTVLIVDQSGKPGTFSKVADALKVAREGAKIEIREETWDERLEVDGEELPKSIKIVSASPSGHPVVWTSSRAATNKPLIHLKGVKHLTIEGFVFDGEKGRETLIRLDGNCAATSLSKLHVKSYLKSGITLACQGEPDAPVQCRFCRFTPLDANSTAIDLQGTAQGAGEHLELKNNRIEKPSS